MAVKLVLQLVVFALTFPCFSYSASIMHQPSAVFSTSWINNDFIPGFNNYDNGWIVRPLLSYNRSTIMYFPAFGCGFYGNRRNNSFFFAIFAMRGESTRSDWTGIIPSWAQVLWTANRAKPVRENATLNFTSDGDLVLRDSDGTYVWSSNTSTNSAWRMNVTGNGSLILVNSQDQIVWQSLDYPTDTWLPGQKLMPGQGLIASVSQSNWTPGPFYLSFVDHHLFAFMESDDGPPLMYGDVFRPGNGSNQSISRAVSRQFNIGRLVLEFGPLAVHAEYVSEIQDFQCMRLESDGHLKVYHWIQGAFVGVAYDILTDNLGDCAYPTVCGNYGICTLNERRGECSCPRGNDNVTSYFRQLDLRGGCVATTQLSCHSTHLHHLLELDQVSYFSFITEFANTDIESCKQACLRNCSCKAAFFRYNLNPSIGNCSLPSQIFSLMNVSQALHPYNSSSFIKVQKSLVALAPPPAPNPPFGPKTIPESARKKPSGFTLILVPTLVALVIAFLIVLICVRVIRKRKYSSAVGRRNSIDEEWDNSLNLVSNLPKRFTYEELKLATDNFHTRLGGGGFGSVFEGTLSDGTKIATKRLDRLGQGRKEFLAEVKTVGSIHHVNLVRLMGFCAEKSHKLLVYECMSNGSLDKWIFHRNPEMTLEWEIRKNIILNIAKGLTYLHEDCRTRIAHLDVKPQNILLDDNFHAKLSDFGLARLIDRNHSQAIKQMRGTRGYMAPEWLSRKITEKVDVYSFGIVVLEIVCGRKNFDFSQPEDTDYLLLHVVKKKAEENRLLDLIDHSIEDMQQHGEEVVKMMRIAIWCLHNDFTSRPSMSIVVKVLEGAMDMEHFSDYSFLTSTVAEAPTEVNILASNPQPAFVLSGPR